MKELKADEAAAFATLNQLCTEQGLLKRPQELNEDDVLDGINDQTALLRFLYARKMKPQDALTQFRDATTFHVEKKVLPFYDLMSVDDYEDTRRFYPHWTGRRDRQGLPIMMIDLAHLNGNAMACWRETRGIPCAEPSLDTASSPDMAQRASVFHDGLTRFILPLCTAMNDRPDPSSPVTKSTYVVDGTTLSLKQAWDVRDFAQDISGILSTCYPETIDHIFLCNVSSSFSMIWTALKKFVDPITADKLVVLKSADVYKTLDKYIDHSNIPSSFGGDFTFNNGMLPDIDDGIRQTLLWASSKDNLPPGPLKWVQDGENRKAVATGSVDGVQRAEEIAFIRKPGNLFSVET